MPSRYYHCCVERGTGPREAEARDSARRTSRSRTVAGRRPWRRKTRSFAQVRIMCPARAAYTSSSNAAPLPAAAWPRRRPSFRHRSLCRRAAQSLLGFIRNRSGTRDAPRTWARNRDGRKHPGGSVTACPGGRLRRSPYSEERDQCEKPMTMAITRDLARPLPPLGATAPGTYVLYSSATTPAIAA